MAQFIMDGGIFMWIIILCGIVIAGVSLERIYRLYLRKENDADSVRRRLPALKMLGIATTLLGVLGTLLGMHQAFSSERLLAAGMPIYEVARIAMSTSIAGLTISVLALLAYGVFSARARRLESAL